MSGGKTSPGVALPGDAWNQVKLPVPRLLSHQGRG